MCSSCTGGLKWRLRDSKGVNYFRFFFREIFYLKNQQIVIKLSLKRNIILYLDKYLTPLSTDSGVEVWRGEDDGWEFSEEGERRGLPERLFYWPKKKGEMRGLPERFFLLA